MEKENTLLRLMGTILGLTVLISLLVLGFGMLSPWTTPVQFSNGFFIAGALLIVFGFFSVAGGFGQRANFSMTYAESAGQASLAERTQRMMADINQRYGLMVVLVGVGILLIGISIVIDQFSQ
jgi:hypothetical protein